MLPPRTGATPDAFPSACFEAAAMCSRRRPGAWARGVPVGQGKSYVSRPRSGRIGWWACITARRCKGGAALAAARAVCAALRVAVHRRHAPPARSGKRAARVAVGQPSGDRWGRRCSQRKPARTPCDDLRGCFGVGRSRRPNPASGGPPVMTGRDRSGVRCASRPLVRAVTRVSGTGLDVARLSTCDGAVRDSRAKASER